MALTLEIFGDEFTNVAGIKAKNDNDETVVFFNAADGNNSSYGLTDGSLPLVGVGKVGSIEI